MMTDAHNPIPKGMRGEVINIDDIGTLHMKWQNGSGLGVVVGEDSFKVIRQTRTRNCQNQHMSLEV